MGFGEILLTLPLTLLFTLPLPPLPPVLVLLAAILAVVTVFVLFVPEVLMLVLLVFVFTLGESGGLLLLLLLLLVVVVVFVGKVTLVACGGVLSLIVTEATGNLGDCI